MTTFRLVTFVVPMLLVSMGLFAVWLAWAMLPDTLMSAGPMWPVSVLLHVYALAFFLLAAFMVREVIVEK